MKGISIGPVIYLICHMPSGKPAAISITADYQAIVLTNILGTNCVKKGIILSYHIRESSIC